MSHRDPRGITAWWSGIPVFISSIHFYIDVAMSPRDPRWVGAWWLGFLVFGVSTITLGLPMICFPRRLWRSTDDLHVNEKHLQEEALLVNRKEKIRGIITIIWMHFLANDVFYVCFLVLYRFRYTCCFLRVFFKNNHTFYSGTSPQLSLKVLTLVNLTSLLSV